MSQLLLLKVMLIGVFIGYQFGKAKCKRPKCFEIQEF